MITARTIAGFVVELARGLAVVVVGAGLLYLVAPVLRGLGPALPDALPLDELPHHESVSVWGFAAVWLSVAWAVHRLGPRTRSSLWLRGGAVASAAFVTAAGSVAIVRQISVGEAVSAALRIPALYVLVALFVAGSYVAGRAKRP
jgi:hypothetical protein